MIDEGIAALVFAYAKTHNWLKDVTDIDYQLLRTIKGISSLFEVKECSMHDWQKAILLGFDIWREVLSNNGGKIFVDLDAQSMGYQKLQLSNTSKVA